MNNSFQLNRILFYLSLLGRFSRPESECCLVCRSDCWMVGLDGALLTGRLAGRDDGWSAMSDETIFRCPRQEMIIEKIIDGLRNYK